MVKVPPKFKCDDWCHKERMSSSNGLDAVFHFGYGKFHCDVGLRHKDRTIRWIFENSLGVMKDKYEIEVVDDQVHFVRDKHQYRVIDGRLRFVCDEERYVLVGTEVNCGECGKTSGAFPAPFSASMLDENVSRYCDPVASQITFILENRDVN